MQLLCPKKPLYGFTVNRDCEQAQGLMGWWPGNVVGGPKLLDASGKGNHLSLAGSAITKGIWAPGNGGGKGAVGNFDGSSNYLTTSGVPLGGLSNCTISCWCYLPTSTSTVAFGRPGDSGVVRRFAVLAFNGSLYWVCDTGSASATYNASFGKAGWHLFEMSFSPNTLVLYVDGVAFSGSLGGATIPSAISSVTTESFGVGRERPTGINAVGFYEDLKVYTRTRTAAQAFAAWNPRTRWQLRYQTGRKLMSFGVSGNRRRQVICAGAM